MTDHSAFFFVHFLLCHLHPSFSTSECNKFVKNKILQWVSIDQRTEFLYLNNCGVEYIEYDKTYHLPNLKLLDLSSNHIEALPKNFLSNISNDVKLYLKFNKLCTIPTSVLNNRNLQICSMDCKVVDNNDEWSTLKTCGINFQKLCGSKSSPVLLIVLLLLAILFLCVLGLAWYWKCYRCPSNFSLPRFLHKKKYQNDSDLSHTPCTPTEYTGPKRFSQLSQIKDDPSPLSRDDPDKSYENVETGPKSCARDCLTDLYENTGQLTSEKHLNETKTSSEYYDFQKPNFLNNPPDEDIYIFPDE
ncbi:protein GAPT [Macrotis lagotis]|uniref:protein GAPT n=1 Tax=Macrotis lagotis TaxID=92651 RepID=UPI003D693C62